MVDMKLRAEQVQEHFSLFITETAVF